MVTCVSNTIDHQFTFNQANVEHISVFLPSICMQHIFKFYYARNVKQQLTTIHPTLIITTITSQLKLCTLYAETVEQQY